MASEIIQVASLYDLQPGHMLCVTIDGLPIAIANVAGTIYAFGDVCRHEGASLSTGVLIEDTVTCPWHGWTYNIRTGKSLIPPVGLRIPTYSVTIRNDKDICVEIDWTSTL